MATFTQSMDLIERGDRVKLVSFSYIDSENNPIWDGEEGNIVGTIKERKIVAGDEVLPVTVVWDNGCVNTYRVSDLRLHSEVLRDIINIKFKDKIGTVVCRIKDHYIVNFKEDVEGFSCDGKYKKGSCLIISRTDAEHIEKVEKMGE